jgi:hypothetical protein
MPSRGSLGSKLALSHGCMGERRSFFYKQQRVPSQLGVELSPMYIDVLLPDERSECLHYPRVILG